MLQRYLYFLIVFFLGNEITSATDEDFLLGTKYGFSGSYNFNLQAVDMRQLPSVHDSIPRSATGDGSGFSLGAFYEYRFTNRTSIFLRGFYSYHKAEISGIVPENILDNGNPLFYNVEHKINSDLSSIKIEPLIRYRLFKEFSLFGGLNAGLRFSQEFEHSKSLVKNPNFTFNDGTNYIGGLDRNVEAKLGIQAALVVGFGYDIPVNYNGKYLICPEILMETGYSDIASKLTWDINSIRLGISFKYSENPTIKYKIKEIKKYIDSIKTIKKEISDIPHEFVREGKSYIVNDTMLIEDELEITSVLYRTDTLFYPFRDESKEISKPESIANEKINNDCLKLYAMTSDGKTEFPNIGLSVEEFLSTSIKPLLNYIFFDENSSKISPRYSLLSEGKTNKFKIENLGSTSTIETYYNILNIIGKRLSLNKDAIITLTGYNSGINKEKDNLDLSKRRAEEVKEYLVKNWKINTDRIKIRYANLPEKPSNINDPDGIEENRRVEISSDNTDILAPVIINDTLNEVQPSQVRFYNNAGSCFNIDKWKLEVKQSDISLIIFRGEYKIPERLIWRLSEAKQTIPKNSEAVIYQLEILDFNGNTIKSIPDTILVDKKTIAEKKINREGDKKIDKYSMILFDFDNAELNNSNLKIMDFINNNIRENSKVFIQGYTDRMGNDDYNLNLANRRASNVASKINNSKNISFEGIGEDELIYNNELPEERFYCRTVNVTVETEIEK